MSVGLGGYVCFGVCIVVGVGLGFWVLCVVVYLFVSERESVWF